MQHDSLAVNGRVLDIHLDGGELVLVVEVGGVAAGNTAVNGWRRWLVAEGQSFPRFRGDPELAAAGVWLGREVRLQVERSPTGWTYTRVAPCEERPAVSAALELAEPAA